MQQLYYAFLAIKNSGGNNLIKIVSLSLGLLIGLLLFSRVAYEANFDNFYKDVDNLYLVKNKYIIGGEDKGSSHIVMAPMAPAINDEFPEVACATSVYANKEEEPFFYEERKFDLKPLFADSLFFKTVGVNVLGGDDRLLSVADNLFISDKAAKLIFGNENPIGKTLMYMHNYPYTIQGVFSTIPNNNSLRGDVVVSFANVKKQWGLGTSWDGGDSFWGVVRLVAGANPSTINQKIPDVWRKHFDFDRLAEAGFEFTSYLSPFKTLHSEDSGVNSTAIIMSSLALIILLVATLNYVLISISSLVKRAKGVGIHKCSGASSGSIFGMFLYETAILVLISLLLVAGSLFVFRTQIETLMDVPLAEIFSLSNLWVSGLVVLFLFLTGGIITLMGLIGYVGDEIQRRRKEIAIRKINGATVGNIFRLITGSLSFIALPAILLAATGAYIVGELVLRMFTVKAVLNAPVFIGGSLAVLLVIAATAVIKSWRIANENPSKTVSSE
ncbi:hypothetical protein FACS1894177_01900 [Bacteroidia bacterium]|nr:hypothetical protein FACS1894177_01900 [Bacteroidia bacterium]